MQPLFGNEDGVPTIKSFKGGGGKDCTIFEAEEQETQDIPAAERRKIIKIEINKKQVGTT